MKARDSPAKEREERVVAGKTAVEASKSQKCPELYRHHSPKMSNDNHMSTAHVFLHTSQS